MTIKPSCLSCESSEPYAPKCRRYDRRHRCTNKQASRYLQDVDVSMVPGKTIRCMHFSEPSLPFAFRETVFMPEHLL